MTKWRKLISVTAAAALIAVSATACSSGSGKSTSSAAASGGKPYIAVIAKGFQFQYWQVVMQGAQKAANELGVKMTFDGPPSETNIDQQVNMLNAALAKHPVAICLAALDTNSVKSQISEAKSQGIPVIGFDSGVPNAPAGTIQATAATDNYKAAALAADEMFKNTDFQTKVKAGTTTKPALIGVLSQDATSASVTQRTKGFIDEMKKNIESLDGFSGAVEITGQVNYNASSKSPAKANIVVNVPPTTQATDLQHGAEALLTKENLISIYGSNEGAADGILAATNDGSDFAGKYKAVTACGFDAGKVQKNAVSKGWFIGSITQDPYQIGYQSIQLAYKAYKKESVSDVDTGAKWYNNSNMTESDIAKLLYD